MRNIIKKTLVLALSLCLVAVFLLPVITALQPGCACVEITCPICEAMLERYESLALQEHSVYIMHANCDAFQYNLAEIFVSGFIDSNTRMNN
ncbi:MAG: hypothetical protein FWD06_02645 [Oscillospiraceae bacterium]|nr:hypothetical protein [Oscillospiraceae bacterium]